MVTAHDGEAAGAGRAAITRVRDLAPADLDGVRVLFREYAQGLDALGHQVCARGFEAEVLGLPGEYCGPAGRVIVAEEAPRDKTSEPGPPTRSTPSAPDLVGVVALRRLTRATCEMKRLYVRPAFRASGGGRQLAIAAVAAGKAIGYERLVLDTLPAMSHAVALYRDLGFHQIARYNENHAPGVVFLERRLV